MADPEEQQEPHGQPEPEVPEVYTVWRVYGEGGRATLEFETNDDNDDGYPDAEVVRATFHPKDVQAALDIAGGKSHLGQFGQKVEVYLNGVKV